MAIVIIANGTVSNNIYGMADFVQELGRAYAMKLCCSYVTSGV